jgi:hypothetical protein
MHVSTIFPVFGVFFIIFGLAYIIRPDWVYQKTQAWKNESSSEPSEAFILSTRVTGVIITASGLALLIGPFVFGA